MEYIHQANDKAANAITKSVKEAILKQSKVIL